jgi:hypothetical protein
VRPRDSGALRFREGQQLRSVRTLTLNRLDHGNALNVPLGGNSGLLVSLATRPRRCPDPLIRPNTLTRAGSWAV